MKKYLAWIVEALIWVLVIIICVMGSFWYKKIKLKQKHSYHVFFTDANGLKEGSPVKIMGKEVGYVSGIRIIKNKVFVSFVITNPDVVLPAGVTANIELTGLVGSRSLELYPPTSETPETEAIVSPLVSDRVQGAYSNSSRTSEILYNAARNLNQSMPIEQLPQFRKFIKDRAEEVKGIPNQIEEINQYEDKAIQQVQNNKSLKEFNKKMEKLSK